MATRKYNNLKHVLKQKKRTGKWLAGELVHLDGLAGRKSATLDILRNP